VSGGQPAGAAPGIARLRAERLRWEFAWRGIRRLGLLLFTSLFTVSAVLPRQGQRPGFAGRGLAVLALVIAVLLAFAAVHVTVRRRGGPSLAAAGILIASSAALMWVQPTGPVLGGRVPLTEAMAWLISAFSVGTAAGSAVAGQVIDVGGARWGYVLVAGCGAGACLAGLSPLRTGVTSEGHALSQIHES
jgi:hypothetical protein